MTTDPIEREGFDPNRPRKPNTERMARIRRFALAKRGLEENLTSEIREAIETGHSYRQVANAAGVSVSVIQRMVKE